MVQQCLLGIVKVSLLSRQKDQFKVMLLSLVSDVDDAIGFDLLDTVAQRGHIRGSVVEAAI